MMAYARVLLAVTLTLLGPVAGQDFSTPEASSGNLSTSGTSLTPRAQESGVGSTTSPVEPATVLSTETASCATYDLFSCPLQRCAVNIQGLCEPQELPVSVGPTSTPGDLQCQAGSKVCDYQPCETGLCFERRCLATGFKEIATICFQGGMQGTCTANHECTNLVPTTSTPTTSPTSTPTTSPTSTPPSTLTSTPTSTMAPKSLQLTSQTTPGRSTEPIPVVSCQGQQDETRCIPGQGSCFLGLCSGGHCFGGNLALAPGAACALDNTSNQLEGRCSSQAECRLPSTTVAITTSAATSATSSTSTAVESCAGQPFNQPCQGSSKEPCRRHVCSGQALGSVCLPGPLLAANVTCFGTEGKTGFCNGVVAGCVIAFEDTSPTSTAGTSTTTLMPTVTTTVTTTTVADPLLSCSAGSSTDNLLCQQGPCKVGVCFSGQCFGNQARDDGSPCQQGTCSSGICVKSTTPTPFATETRQTSTTKLKELCADQDFGQPCKFSPCQTGICGCPLGLCACLQGPAQPVGTPCDVGECDGSGSCLPLTTVITRGTASTDPSPSSSPQVNRTPPTTSIPMSTLTISFQPDETPASNSLVYLLAAVDLSGIPLHQFLRDPVPTLVFGQVFLRVLRLVSGSDENLALVVLSAVGTESESRRALRRRRTDVVRLSFRVEVPVQDLGRQENAMRSSVITGNLDSTLTAQLRAEPSYDALVSVQALNRLEVRQAVATTVAAVNSVKEENDTVLAIVLGSVSGVLLLFMSLLLLVWVRRGSRKATPYVANPAGNNVAVSRWGAEQALKRQARIKQQQQLPVERPTSRMFDNFQVARLESNSGKNRYRDILPYDHTRVTLAYLPGRPGSDYINANFVHGYGDTVYIATQGPTQRTLADFWRMVWEQRTKTIAMIAQFREGNKEKVTRYFPEAVGQVAHYDQFVVVTEQLQVNEDYRFSTLRVRFSGTSRLVYHCQFLKWPDHDAPKETGPFLHFWRQVRLINRHETGPLVVHCSAGVGRSGCYIVVDTEIERYQAAGEVSVFDAVVRLRRYRPFLVQTASQYIFAHRAIIDGIFTEVPQPASWLPPDTQRVLQAFQVPKALSPFDMGAPGREVLALGHFVLHPSIEDVRHYSPVAEVHVVLLLCTDVVVLAMSQTLVGQHVMLAPAADRRELSLTVQDLQQEWDEPLLSFCINKVTYVLEAAQTSEKTHWLSLLTACEGYQPTQELRGARMLPVTPATPAEILGMLGLPSPSLQAHELATEWELIPKMFTVDPNSVQADASYLSGAFMAGPGPARQVVNYEGHSRWAAPPKPSGAWVPETFEDPETVVDDDDYAANYYLSSTTSSSDPTLPIQRVMSTGTTQQGPVDAELWRQVMDLEAPSAMVSLHSLSQETRSEAAHSRVHRLISEPLRLPRNLLPQAAALTASSSQFQEAEAITFEGPPTAKTKKEKQPAVLAQPANAFSMSKGARNRVRQVQEERESKEARAQQNVGTAPALACSFLGNCQCPNCT